MVNPASFKQRVLDIVSQEYRVEFLGKNFDDIVNLLTDTKANRITQWVERVVASTIQPILVGSKKRYKQWTVSELLTFRYPFRLGNAEYRILFIKVKNSIYLEFHLGDHKYYDKVRRELDL